MTLPGFSAQVDYAVPLNTLPEADAELISRFQHALVETLGEHTHAAINGTWNDAELAEVLMALGDVRR